MKYSLSTQRDAGSAISKLRENGASNGLDRYLIAERAARQAALEKKQKEEEEKKKKENGFVRTLATGGDLLGSVLTGAVKGVEGIVDAGIGLTGFVGGLFSEDFKEGAKRAVEYDWTQENLGKHIDKATEGSFARENEILSFIKDVTGGVGQMLPAVAISLATAGLGAPAAAAQAASLATMGVSAAGSSTEEAYKDGADYDEGLLYGAARGATEAVTEKLTGGLTSGVFGKGILNGVGKKTVAEGAEAATKSAIKSIGKESAETGLKRVLKGAAEEGAEEIFSELLVPGTKTIYKGKDALAEYGEADYWTGVAKAGLAGAGTGLAYSGTVGYGMSKLKRKDGTRLNYVGRDADVNSALEANENVKEILTRAQNEGADVTAMLKRADEVVTENYRKIEKALKGATEAKRASMIQEFSLDKAFNPDGTLKPDFLTRGNGAKAETDGEFKYSFSNKTSGINERDLSLTPESEVSAFIDSVLSMKDRNLTSKRLKKLGGVSRSHAEIIKRETNIDVSDYEIWLDGSTVLHINERHGENGIADSSMQNPQDLARVASVVNSADDGSILEKADGSFDKDRVYRNSDQSPAVLLRFYKKESDGTYFVVECVPDSSQKRLYIRSAYKQKNGGKDQQLNMVEKPRNKTPEALAGSNATTNSIPNSGKIVNPSDEIFSKSAKTPQNSQEATEAPTEEQTVTEAPKMQNSVSKRLESEFYSVKLRGRENEIRADLKKLSEDTGEEILPFHGKLTEEGEKNFRSFKKALTSLNSEGGSDVAWVVVDTNSSFNGVIKSGDIIYVAADALERGIAKGDLASFAGTLTHEFSHAMEGSSEFDELTERLKQDDMLLAAAMNAVEGGYGISIDEAHRLRNKKKAGEKLTDVEKRRYEKFESELAGKMNEYALGNEHFVRRLIARDGSLAEKIVYRIFDLKANLASRTDAASRAEYKLLKDAERLYLKAARAVNNARLIRLLTVLEDKEDNETTGFSKYSYDSLISKPDLNIVPLSEDLPVNDKGIFNRRAVINAARENARSKNNPNNTEKETYVFVPDISLNVRINRDGLEHGLSHRAEDTATATMSVGDLLENSIAINELNKRITDKKETEMSYVLLAAGKNKNGSFVARLVIDKNTNTLSEISTYGLYAIRAKKEGALFLSKDNEGVEEDTSVPYLGSTISIADFLDNVKSLDLVKEVFSKDVAEKLSVNRTVGDLTKGLRYSRKSKPISEGSVHSRVAEVEKLRVYDKRDAEKIISTVMSEVMMFDEYEYGELNATNKREATKQLWERLNAALTDKELTAAAENVADYIINHSVVRSWLYDFEEGVKLEAYAEKLATIRPYLKSLDLSGIKDEISHKYGSDRSIYSRWHKKNGRITVDIAAKELQGLGIQLEANTEADLLFELDDLYLKAKRALEEGLKVYLNESLGEKEYAKLRAEIRDKILESRKEVGRDSKYAEALKEFNLKLGFAEYRVKYMQSMNKLLGKVDSFKEVVSGAFQNANTYKTDIFDKSINQLKSITRGGLLSAPATRKAAKNLREWYNPDNPVVGDAYDSSIAAALGRVGDKVISDFIGGLDFKDVLDEYRHKLDLSPIRDRIRAEYPDKSRSIFATWNVKKGETGITLEQLAEDLNKLGLGYFGDGFDTFTSALVLYEDTAGPLHIDDIEDLSLIVGYFKKFIENFNKVYRKGKYVDALPRVKEYIAQMHRNKHIKVGWIHKFVTSRYGRFFFRPATIVRYMDRYDNGFYTEMLDSFREGMLNASNYEYEMMQAVAEFDKNNKGYFEELSRRTVKFRGTELPADIALSLYMTAKREQAQAGLVISGFKYEPLKGDEPLSLPGNPQKNSYSEVQLEAERIQKLLYDEFSKEDKQFIKIAEELFNGECKRLKHDTDMDTKGYTNTVDGYYYPIKRAFVAKSIDSDFEEPIERATNQSFNKDTVKGAKGELCIMPLTDMLRRHVRGVAQYASLATVIRNYDVYYNLDISGKPNSPESIASVGETVWKDGHAYMKKLLSDMQGVNDGSSAFLASLRSKYATYQLGLNPKTWVTQFSSLVASTSVLDFDSVIKGVGVPAKDVDEFCTLAKLRNANNDAVLAQANSRKRGILTKRTKFGDMTDRVSDALMTPIGKVDRFVIERLFGACQLQVEKDGGAKLGTRENKKAAGELLEKVIFATQQNSFATERSAAMRSGDFFKGLTMFSADSMNVFGQVIDSLGEVSVLKSRLNSEANPDEQKKLGEQLKDAGKRARKSLVALASSAVMMSLIALLFRALYRKIDDEETAGDIAVDTVFDAVGNMLGGLPVFRDAFTYLNDGYEVNNYFTSTLNDTLETVSGIRDLVGKAVAGENIDTQEITRSLRSTFYSFGQLTGLPSRNAYNIVRAAVGAFGDEAIYKFDNTFYKQAYSKDLSKAIEAGDEDMIATITGIMTGENVGDISDKTAREELNRLTLAGKSVLPRSVGDSVTVNGETYELTASQKKKLKKVYSIANESVAELVSLKGYGKSEDGVKAKAIKRIYDIYYSLALYDTLGIEPEDGTAAQKNILFAEAIDLELLALIVSTAESLEADRDKHGNPISGSRKAKIEKYIGSLNITAAEKHMIMGYLGYKNKNGKEKVTAYVNRLKLTRAEKSALLEFSGYDAAS